MNLSLAQKHELARKLAERRDECQQALRELSASRPTPKLIRRIRDDFGSDLASHLLAVAELQPNARRKFGEGQWWVTDRSLQQSTPRQVAALKANWLGDGDTFDLCCGVGGDAMQLAARGCVTAVDSDPLIAEMAGLNLSQVESSRSHRVRCEDVTEVSIPPGCRVHLDPDRRAQSRRTSQPESYQPRWSEVVRLVEQSESAVVKLAPAARLPSPAVDSHRAWISLDGRVREQSLVCGEALGRLPLDVGGVSAWIVRSHAMPVTFSSADEGSATPAKSPLPFLVDPDAAIRASGMTEAFAVRFQLQTLGGPAGFLTGEPIETEACAAYGAVHRVVWWGSADDRKLRRELRSRDSYPESIKVRGTDHDPASLTKRYRKCGTQPVWLWIGRSSSGVYAAITEPFGGVS